MDRMLFSRSPTPCAEARQALTVFRDIDDPGHEAAARNSLCDVLLRTGQADQARAHHAAALRLATQATTPPNRPAPATASPGASQADGNTRAQLTMTGQPRRP